jgi:hypothetical protein
VKKLGLPFIRISAVSGEGLVALQEMLWKDVGA